MNESQWNESITSGSLMQGDLLFACPITTMLGPWAFPMETKNIDLKTVDTDVVVMTQNCDLENDKADQVLLARLVNWKAMVQTESAKENTAVKSRDFRKKLIEG